MPVLVSQTFAVLSLLAVTIRETSGLNAAELTSGVPREREDLRSPRGVPDLCCPVTTGGEDPRPVRAKRTELTKLSCPLSVRISAPVLASQTFAVLSKLPVTIRDPSGLNDAEPNPLVCPLSVRTSVPFLASQIFAVLS